MIQEFDFVGTRQIDAAGTFFLFDSADAVADQRIKLTVDGQPIGKYLPGDNITLPNAAKKWSIEPVTAGMQGRVMIGFGKVESSRISGNMAVSGTVAVSGIAGTVTTVPINRVSASHGVSENIPANTAVQFPANASRTRIIWRNTGTTKLYLSCHVTGAMGYYGAIELLPGDMWIETEAAHLAWYLYSDADGGRCANQIVYRL